MLFRSQAQPQRPFALALGLGSSIRLSRYRQIPPETRVLLLLLTAGLFGLYVRFHDSVAWFFQALWRLLQGHS